MQRKRKARARRKLLRKIRRCAPWVVSALAVALIVMLATLFFGKNADERVRAESTPAPTAAVTTMPAASAPAPEPTPTPVPALTPMPAPTAEPITLTMNFGGDCTLGVNMNSGNRRFSNTASKMGYAYFFQNLADTFARDDLTVVNLEGPLTTATSKRADREFNFRGLPEYAQILSLGNIDAVTLANNHFKDYRTQGVNDTTAALDEAGVGYFGYATSLVRDVKGVKVGFLGYTQWETSLTKIKAAIAEMRPNVDILIVNIHWGEEKRNEATSTQKKLGRGAIDAGADLVIGHHPHVVGGIEIYKGKRIVYSVGNLCFGGNDTPHEWVAFVFQETFTFDPNTGEAAVTDDMLLPIRVSGSTKRNDFQPVLLEGEEAVNVLKRVYKFSKGFSETLDFEALAARYGA